VNKKEIHTACPHIDGTLIQDLLGFLEEHGHKDYLPDVNRSGKPLKYDRDWLLTVRFTHLNQNFKI
jgi:hypothetical protein